jgi:nitrogen fixation NifU-like protein
MYSDLLLDHFKRPRNVGELPPPAIVVEVTNPACGDILKLSARFENGRIAEVAYKVRGCTATIAAGSALTELLLARNLNDIAALTPAHIEAAVGGLSPESKHAAILCRDAVKTLLMQQARNHPPQ